MSTVKILVTGNMGYVGPSVVVQLRRRHPGAVLIGLDAGYFAHCLTSVDAVPERRLDCQHFGDVRAVDPQLLEGVDVIVHLAAVSNDPIGNAFEQATFAVNHHATVSLAERAKEVGVRAFVFASSCSLYGSADGGTKEDSPIRPLTAYATSKARAEEGLASLADADFVVTSLRFATACGMSDRLRLDLVLNDFVASAVACRRIELLSDGSAWRPLVHVRDMARAFEWAVGRELDAGRPFLAVNAGSDAWNYRIRDLAEAVARQTGVPVVMPATPAADRRSYRVSFALYRSLAPRHQPRLDLETTVRELVSGLREMGFADPNFRSSPFARLAVLRSLQRRGLLTHNLEWTAGPRAASPTRRSPSPDSPSPVAAK